MLARKNRSQSLTEEQWRRCSTLKSEARVQLQTKDGLIWQKQGVVCQVLVWVFVDDRRIWNPSDGL